MKLKFFTITFQEDKHLFSHNVFAGKASTFKLSQSYF